MPPSNPKIERNVTELLKEYLGKKEEEEAKGITLANLFIMLNQQNVDLKQAKSTLILHGLRLDRHGQEIRGLKHKVHHLEGSPEGGFDDVDTGQYQVADLQRLLAENASTKQAAALALAQTKAFEERDRENATWWKRSAISWVAGGIGALILATLMGAGGYIFASITLGKGK